MQGFFSAEESEKIDEYLAHHLLTPGECVRWLVLDALHTRRVPPAEED